MSDAKNIRLLHAPDDPKPAWPVPPVYVQPWDAAQIRAAVEALVKFQGQEARAVVEENDIIDLILRIKADYDMALSKAQREVWQWKGMLEGSK